MENASHLDQTFCYLCTRMDDLKLCRDQVAGRKQPEMDGWVQKVKGREDEVDKLRRELGKLNGGRGSKSLDAHNLNKKVWDNVHVVERLKKEFSAGSESVNTYLDKTAKRYSYGDIKRFISTFSNSKLSGDDGDIYTGQFDEKQVAVKVLPEEYVVDEIFITEVSTIARAAHRHVVKLYGFCFEGSMRALVYEYAKNGSFDKILYENHLNLAWEQLYSIALETAKGIAYLHDGCDEQIIHHDIQAHNVLVDKYLSPKVTSFGLAKLLERDVSRRTLTRTRGTVGYAAPEMWEPASPITAKCDVYSFGMMLFEILGKRKNRQGKNWFPKKVWEKFEKGQLNQFIREDCKIVERDHKKATVLSTLALWCAQKTPEIRPSMSKVVIVLENEELFKSPPNPFQHQPSLLSPLIPRGISSTIDESFPERAEEFVSSSSSAPTLKNTSSDNLNNTDNSGIRIPRSGKALEIFDQYPRKCPPVGEDSVICYTTTSVKPKRSFKESNYVRSILQSHQIKMIERDVCGDGNYDDELDDLMGAPLIIPVLLVKGRYIGGASEVKKLEEEGKLKMLFDGI